MRTIQKTVTLLVLAGCGAFLAGAQSSASFKLAEHTLNAGGRPMQGVTSASPSFRVSLESIGDSIFAHALSSASYRADGGYVVRYAPPGEVHGVHFPSHDALAWSAQWQAPLYNLYRGTVSSLPGGFGDCVDGAFAGAAYTDPVTPSSGIAYFYLVTAENRLSEEGTKGWQSDGTQRPNAAPCP